jgi:Fic family protein
LDVLKIQEIEKIITENLALVQKFIMRNSTKLTINHETAKKLHHLLAANLFEQAGNYRKHNVQLGYFEPPDYFKIPVFMKNWEGDLRERVKHVKNRDMHIENCAWLMHRFLWIHPFFDYNGRINRLLGELYLMQNNLI